MTAGQTVVGPQYLVRTLEICLSLALACSSTAALDSDRTIAQFAHTAWGPKDGAPSVVQVLAQSTDGYLWLGTPEGLYRFDGVVFDRYRPQSGDPLPAHSVFSLLALPNGDLWIGFRAGGISLLRSGHVTNYTTRDGVPNGGIWSLAQDREGMIWVATNSGLARLEGDRWKSVGKDWKVPRKSAYTIFLDRQGTLWVSTEDTVVFLPPGTRRFQPTGIKVGQVGEIAQAASGKLWMAETTRSVRPIPLDDKRQPPDDTEVKVGSQGILFDNDGALWITSLGDGLRRSPAPELLKGQIKEYSTLVESFTARDGLSDDLVRTILQDREGNIWVGTNNGLDRFRKTNLVPVVFPYKEGARLYGTTNPDSPYHWLKAKYLDNLKLRSRRILWSERFTMADNPNLTREFVEAQKKLYTGFFYKRFIEGLWVVAEGAIYKDSWSEDLLYDQKDEPAGLRTPGCYQQRIIAVDYGTANPMVFLDIYDDGRRFWVVREYYWDSVAEMRQKTDAEYADDLAAFIGAYNDAKVIVDPSAASFKAELTKRGIWQVDADNEVNEGIRIVSMVLNQRLVRFCRQTTPKTVQEMQTYAWDSKAAQRGEEKPLKLHDHGPDAFRYFVKSEVPHWRLLPT